MNKHNEQDGGARDLDVLLGKLKERHDAREQSGIFTPEDEFKRRFFAAAKAQERPHFPMIWKAAACIAVCLFAFQLVLTTLKDDSSAARTDGYGVPGVDMVVDTQAPAAYGAASLMKATATENVTSEDNAAPMLLASMKEDDDAAEEGATADGEAMVASSLALAQNDAGSGAAVMARRMTEPEQTVGNAADSAIPARQPGMGGFGGAAGGFGGGAPAGGGLGGFGGASGRTARMNVESAQKNASGATAATLMKSTNVADQEGARTMNETQDLYLRPRPRP
ncbi:MAG: hypothetical protein IKO02_01790, partial [Lentisphaeria bacterium]|nr:hypothetical protein [Lentisphaeria bacterium]